MEARREAERKIKIKEKEQVRVEIGRIRFAKNIKINLLFRKKISEEVQLPQRFQLKGRMENR